MPFYVFEKHVLCCKMVKLFGAVVLSVVIELKILLGTLGPIAPHRQNNGSSR
jgi:hypothetical protein